MAQAMYFTIVKRADVSTVARALYSHSHIVAEQPYNNTYVKVYVQTNAPAADLAYTVNYQRHRLASFLFGTTLI